MSTTDGPDRGPAAFGADEGTLVRQFLVQDPDGYLLRFQQGLGHRPSGSSASASDSTPAPDSPSD